MFVFYVNMENKIPRALLQVIYNILLQMQQQMGSGSNFIKTKEDISIHIPQSDLSSVPYQLLVPVSSSRYPLPFAHHPDPWLGAQVYDPFHL